MSDFNYLGPDELGAAHAFIKLLNEAVDNSLFPLFIGGAQIQLLDGASLASGVITYEEDGFALQLRETADL